MSSIEELATALVQQAPDLDPRTIAELRDQLWAVGSPLALAIARIYELVDIDVVDPAIALPALAEACATLVAGIEGRVGERELEAARYQIDTLEPVPDKPPRVAAPDVPITKLRKR
ncbi:MAG TPA: hypothetical protein VFV99_02970 [Kofleriaceae bacterium]|nr:hypothetical protein [Kofleriaceae bacterium]